METMKIRLGKSSHKLGVNEINKIGISLHEDRRIIPPDNYTAAVDAYDQYFKEKDASDKYRLSFTVNPICTNALFNVITEPVMNEGSEQCVAILSTKDTIPDYSSDSIYPKDVNDSRRGARAYNAYKYHAATWKIGRFDVVHDTGYSHKNCGNFDYHCGYDIFDNHYLLRKDGFFVINKIGGRKKADKFNTIEDNIRDRDGSVVTDKIFVVKDSTRKLNDEYSDMHVYYADGVNTYYEAVSENLVEKDGWIGFLNKTSIPVANYNENIINKCINNKPAYGIIDMYPGRDLYSFVPKYNAYRKREERNWDFCITYPFSSTTSDYNGDTIRYLEHSDGTNGLMCDTDIDFDTDNPYVTFKTAIRNGFTTGEFVKLYFLSGTIRTETLNPIIIRSVGEDGRTFSVRRNEVYGEIYSDVGSPKEIYDIRVAKYLNGGACKYYVRLLKKVDADFEGDVMKLAFSQNAYSDRVAEILYNGDIVTSGLHDNIGRPISELFLTIVKRNSGYKKWYGENNFTDEEIEYSHCFGSVSAGIDMPSDEFCSDYNIHRIHSISNSVAIDRGISVSPKHIDEDITIDGNEYFYGDIVEYSAGGVSERVISPIYYRFNTAQRETSNREYSAFTYTEFEADDYDFSEFSVKNTNPIRGKRVNLMPEGYYYNPNYRIKIHEYSEEVQQGSDIKLTLTGEWEKIDPESLSDEWKYLDGLIGPDEDVYSVGLSTNYNIERNDVIYGILPNRSGGYDVAISGTVVGSNYSGNYAVAVSFNGEPTKKMKFYRRNPERPDTAVLLGDGTGRYVWRYVMPNKDIPTDSELYDSVFTNGAHYIHKNIMFYLRRQDPEAEYGIGIEPNDVADSFILNNVSKDISISEYKEEGSVSQC